jgi:hypothetical protein
VQELYQKQAFILFEESIKSDATKRMYTFHLKKYLDSIGVADPLFQNDPKAITEKIIEFIIKLKREGKGYFSIHNHISAYFYFRK